MNAPFRSFLPIAFCEFGSDGSRYEEPPLPPTTGGISRYYVFLTPSCFLPFTFFEYGSRLAQMLGKTRSRLTTSCNECPLPVFSSICFLRIRFRWIQLRGALTSTDDGRKFPLLRFSNAIVFPSIYLFRIWLQVGSDARKNAKQADDVMQRMSRSGLFFQLLFATLVQLVFLLFT